MKFFALVSSTVLYFILIVITNTETAQPNDEPTNWSEISKAFKPIHPPRRQKKPAGEDKIDTLSQKRGNGALQLDMPDTEIAQPSDEATNWPEISKAFKPIHPPRRQKKPAGEENTAKSGNKV
ncbi:hypothetical protein DdX_14021 [Ditylenchus destructor]|uniref:Uncharacterized protein n=1 Tax=Ditylenchus destructor TaxID=166010 RepID=A0AAD4MU65_9BILA|nr:hypothetical protein DdX_14021 [Ditylenchus destructor]